MKRIVVTGATSMIGTALIEECLRHDVEVYAVVRADSSKKDRLPRDKRVHLIDGSLEDLSMLPGRISEKCDTFYHIAWGIQERTETGVRNFRAEISPTLWKL